MSKTYRLNEHTVKNTIEMYKKLIKQQIKFLENIINNQNNTSNIVIDSLKSNIARLYNELNEDRETKLIEAALHWAQLSFEKDLKEFTFEEKESLI